MAADHGKNILIYNCSFKKKLLTTKYYVHLLQEDIFLETEEDLRNNLVNFIFYNIIDNFCLTL